MRKLLFATMLPFYPDASGGSERSSVYLFENLQRMGWEIQVMCELPIQSPYFRRACWQALSRFQKLPPIVMDQDLGYPCWRQISRFSREEQWLESFEQRLQDFQPDVVLTHYRPSDLLFLKRADQLNYSTVCFARWLNSPEVKLVLPERTHVIVNSPFTASALAKETKGSIEVVLPFVDCEQYRVKQRQRRYITFINPIPEKGLTIAIEAARRLPQEKFLFVKGKWGRYSSQEIKAFMKPIEKLPNVEVWDYQRDMRRVYEMTDILLAPSQFDETFGRVIIEANINGIPVVAAHVGGIPYTLGEGGILVNPRDHIQGYVEALQKLRNDEVLYQQLSKQAMLNSQRSEFNSLAQVNKFIHFVENSIRATSKL
jgi:glycosyltransferase involved in cell wall biosynthesis